MSRETAAPGVIERSLGEHIRERSNGILAIGDGKVRRLFCLQQGRLVHAASNLIEEQLGEFLVRERYLTASDRDRSVQEGALQGVADLQWLQDQELIETAELDKAIGLHTTGLLLSALGSRNAEASFQEVKTKDYLSFFSLSLSSLFSSWSK